MSDAPTKNKRPLIFLAVGIVNTLLDFAFYTLLTQTILSGSDRIALAGIISGTFALVCAFTTHSLITWRGRGVTHKTVISFIVCTGIGMWLIRPLLLSIFIKMSVVYEAAHHLSTLLGLPLSLSFITNTGAFGFMAAILLMYNYVVYERFVFKNKAQ